MGTSAMQRGTSDMKVGEMLIEQGRAEERATEPAAPARGRRSASWKSGGARISDKTIVISIY